MIDPAPDDARQNGIARIGSQPIALAAGALLILLLAAGSVALWRVTTGSFPESDRAVAARQVQARAAEASEQLAEKTKAIGVTQQEQVDQLQALQEQMQGVKRLLAGQQNDAKRLSDQVGTLTSAIDNLRQSFASAQSSDAPSPAGHATLRPRAKTTATKTTATWHVQRKRPKSRS
jgi:multidrug efflux pump subunit AcrB